MFEEKDYSFATDYDWSVCKSDISQTDKELISVLTDPEYENILQKKIIGEKYYVRFRTILNSDPDFMLVNGVHIPIPPNDVPKKKADKIIYENTIKKIETIFLDSVKIGRILVSPSALVNFSALRSEYLEINVIGLLTLLFYLRINAGDFVENVNQQYFAFVANVLLTTKKFISHYEAMDVKHILPFVFSKMSHTSVNDLREQLEIVDTLYNITGMDIINRAPQLLVTNGYSGLYKVPIVPYEHQLKLVQTIRDNFIKGFFIVFNSIIASGKTTAILPLAKYVLEMRQNGFIYLELLFVCCSEGVRTQMANLCWHSNIKFGILESGMVKSIDTHGNASRKYSHAMVNHPRCETFTAIIAEKNGLPYYKKVRPVMTHVDKQTNGKQIVCDRYVTIASPEGAIHLLNSHKSNPDKYIVCFDEPTVEAHVKTSNTLRNNMKLIRNFGKRSVLISGTLPNPEKIQPMINHVKLSYPEVTVDVINTSEISVGCHVSNYQTGDTLFPYAGVKTSEELRAVINKLKTSPFLGRVCDGNVLYKLYQHMQWVEHPNHPMATELQTYFNDINNLSADKIKLKCIALLELLAEQEDHQIEYICSLVLNDEPIGLTHLGTSCAHKLVDGPTIIGSNTPLDTAFEMFDDLLIAINNQRVVIHTLESLNNPAENPPYVHTYESYNHMMKLYGQSKKYYEKLASSNKKIPSEDMAKLVPRIFFSNKFQINTNEHQNKFAPTANPAKRKKSRLALNLEELNLNNSRVCGDLISLLYAGVGVYDLTDTRLDKTYLNAVFTLALKGKLSYIVSNKDICFGVSMPVNNVIVLDSFAEQCSIYTLGQLGGRAGRVGKSDSANLFLGPVGIKKYIDYSRDVHEYDEELANMLEVFGKV